MRNARMIGSTVAVFCVAASLVWADKAAVEKKARDSMITFSIKAIGPAQALDIISGIGGVPIKKVGLPANAPPIALDLKQVSVLDAVRTVARAANLSYVITDDAIVVSAKTKETAPRQ